MFSQGHCDWGLCAIKSVLVVASSLKEGGKSRPEDQVKSSLEKHLRVGPVSGVLPLNKNRILKQEGVDACDIWFTVLFQVLMRALRDFILPKIVTDDIPIFAGLISDLFPALDVPRKRNLQFEQMVKQSTLELPSQPEESFILKVKEFIAFNYSP